MNKPKIYAYCPAGCKWETVHKEDMLKAGAHLPVAKDEDNLHPLDRLQKYRIFANNYDEEEWGVQIRAVLENYDNEVRRAYLSMPWIDKYNSYFDFKLLDFQRVTEEVTREIEGNDIMATLEKNEKGKSKLSINFDGTKYRIYGDVNGWYASVHMKYSDSNGDEYTYQEHMRSWSSGYIPKYGDFKLISNNLVDGKYVLKYELNGEILERPDCKLTELYLGYRVTSVHIITEETSTEPVENTYEFIYEIDGERKNYRVQSSLYEDFVNYKSLTATVKNAGKVYYCNDGITHAAVTYELKEENGQIKLVGSDGSVTGVSASSVVSGGSVIFKYKKIASTSEVDLQDLEPNCIYITTDVITTDSGWVEGSGIRYPFGTKVIVVEDSGGQYYFTALSSGSTGSTSSSRTKLLWSGSKSGTTISATNLPNGWRDHNQLMFSCVVYNHEASIVGNENVSIPLAFDDETDAYGYICDYSLEHGFQITIRVDFTRGTYNVTCNNGTSVNVQKIYGV